jgi:hypothetical protein
MQELSPVKIIGVAGRAGSGKDTRTERGEGISPMSRSYPEVFIKSLPSPPKSYPLIVPKFIPLTLYGGVDIRSRSLKVNVGSRGLPYTLLM